MLRGEAGGASDYLLIEGKQRIEHCCSSLLQWAKTVFVCGENAGVGKGLHVLERGG